MTKVKICGITDLRDALKAHELGADFVGFIFFEKSPRRVDAERARVIVEDLPEKLLKVGLFLNQDLDMVHSIAKRCHLDILQLHGDEDPLYCEQLKRDFKIIKSFRVNPSTTLRVDGEQGRSINPSTALRIDAERSRSIKNLSSIVGVEIYDNVDHYLFDTYVEGTPGGTGESFDWDILKGVSFKKPVFLAGGLTPKNVGAAIKKVAPYAVDVASGVEKSPGKKDYRLLREFIENAKKA